MLRRSTGMTFHTFTTLVATNKGESRYKEPLLLSKESGIEITKIRKRKELIMPHPQL